MNNACGRTGKWQTHLAAGSSVRVGRRVDRGSDTRAASNRGEWLRCGRVSVGEVRLLLRGGIHAVVWRVVSSRNVTPKCDARHGLDQRWATMYQRSLPPISSWMSHSGSPNMRSLSERTSLTRSVSTSGVGRSSRISDMTLVTRTSPACPKRERRIFRPCLRRKSGNFLKVSF